MPSFDEIDKERTGRSQGPGWFTPGEGENKLRIVSESYEVLPSHYLPATKKTMTCFGKENGCPYDTDQEYIKHLVKDGKKVDVKETTRVHRPGLKYLVYVIDRKDGLVKIGKFTYGVIKAVGDYKKSDEWGFQGLPPYDITVKRTKTGPNATDVEYGVIPSRKETPLTEDEMSAIAELTPLSEIVERMKKKSMKVVGVVSDSPSESNVGASTTGPEETEDDEIKVEEIPF